MEFALFLAVVVFFLLLTSVVIVRQGHEYTVESSGRFTRTPFRRGCTSSFRSSEKIGANKINPDGTGS